MNNLCFVVHMKKLITIILAVLFLSACGQKNPTFLYETINSDVLNAKMPDSIFVFSEKDGVGYDVVDEDQITDFVKQFKNIKINEKVDVCYECDTSISFNYEDDFYSFGFFEDIVCVNDKYYVISEYEELFSNIENELNRRFDLNVEYKEVLDYNGLIIQQGSLKLEDNNDYSLELQIENPTANDYSLMIKACVNDHVLHSYQSLGALANTEVGYYYSIPSSLLKEYGQDVIGKIEYTIEVYELNSETHENGALLFNSKPVVNEIASYTDNLKKDDVVFSDDKVDICLKLVDKQSYSCMYIYATNKTFEDVELILKQMKINGEDSDVNSAVYDLKIEKNNDLLALLPINNYVYDEETFEVETIPIKELTLNFDIVNGDLSTNNTIVIDNN